MFLKIDSSIKANTLGEIIKNLPLNTEYSLSTNDHTVTICREQHAFNIFDTNGVVPSIQCSELEEFMVVVWGSLKIKSQDTSCSIHEMSNGKTSVRL